MNDKEEEGFFCPSCGKQHVSYGKYCEYCGEDLEETILDFKEKHLPISYNNRTKVDEKEVVESKDEWDKQREAILRIKKQKEEEKKLQEKEPEPAVEVVASQLYTKLIFGFSMIISFAGLMFIFIMSVGIIIQIALGILFGIILFVYGSGLINIKQIVRLDGRLLFLRHRERRRRTDAEKLAYCCECFVNLFYYL